MLILTQDSYTICVERTTGSKIVLAHPMELLGDVGHLESCFFPFEDSVSVGAIFCIVCARHTIGLEIILDALDGTLR
jgi:hypothetical protein